MRVFVIPAMLIGLTVISCGDTDGADDEESVAARIIELERAALDRWRQGDPGGFLEITADDYTYFDPSLNKRLDGRDSIAAVYERIRGQVSFPRYEIIEPRVQVAGDVAVLTFNFKSFGSDSTGTEILTSHWHTTEVFRRNEAYWELISTHWSYTADWLQEIFGTD